MSEEIKTFANTAKVIKMSPRDRQVYWNVISRIADEIWDRSKSDQAVNKMFQFNREQDS